MDRESFKYYAFISYSHVDQEVAHRLQKRLQYYHLPSDLLKSNPELPKNLKPVFMDESNLVAKGTLQKALQDNLDASNYLIVVCSPNSAQSVYVNDEVDYFIKLGRVDHVIPLIVGGEPHSGDKGRECFPPVLLGLPREQELLGIDLQKFGERDAFLRLIATMLGLDLENFIDEEKRRMKNRTRIFASVVAAVMIAASFLLWYNIPHRHYYSSYVYKWEKPIGLFEVKSETERKKMEYTYCFTTVRGRVQKIERVNSAGRLVNPTIITPFTELPMIHFVSDRVVEYHDLDKKKVYRKEYTKNMQAVDFYYGDSDSAYSVQPYMLDSYEINKFGDSALADEDAIGNIIRHSLEYDDNGYVTRKMFRLNNYGGYDQRGILVKDESSRYGMSYTVDDMGRVIGIRYLNEGRNAMNVSGVYAEHIEYGDTPYPVKVTYEDENGSPVLNSQGIASIHIEYDENLNVEKLSYYGADGERVLDKKYIVSEVAFSHDIENGSLTSERFYGTDLSLSAKGKASVDFERDKEGKITQILLYDAEGKSITSITYVNNAMLDDYLSGKTPIDAEGAYKWGEMLSNGTFAVGHGQGYYNRTDYKLAFEFYKMAAEKGHAEAQYYLGSCYENGYRVGQDYKQAILWYTKAAEQGNADAQLRLGYMYYTGREVGQDYKQAILWYTKAAERGNASAQYYLGVMYENGLGVEQDYKQAVVWYRKSAEQGDADAQFCLGVMYSNNKGVEKDFKQAVVWYRKSAEQGHVDAQYHLGDIYFEGRGHEVEQDYKQSVIWFEKAAEQGHVLAQCHLGSMYEDGDGVDKNLQIAYMWYYLAHLSRNLDILDVLGVDKGLKSLEGQLTEAQITEAKTEAQKKFDKLVAE